MRALKVALFSMVVLAMVSPFATAALLKCIIPTCTMKIYKADGTLGPAIEVPEGTIIDSTKAVGWGPGWAIQP